MTNIRSLEYQRQKKRFLEMGFFDLLELAKKYPRTAKHAINIIRDDVYGFGFARDQKISLIFGLEALIMSGCTGTQILNFTKICQGLKWDWQLKDSNNNHIFMRETK